MSWHAGVRPLIAEARIAARVAALGRQITADFAGKDLIMVTVLRGSFVFAADLARAIDLPLVVDFMALQSYGDDTKSSGVVQITRDLSQSIEGAHVLVVEDIVDTGLTMDYLLQNLATRRPASVKVGALLHKPARSRVAVPIDYLGFTLERDEFVVGYGLDAAQRYRNLPYIGVLESQP